MVHDDTCVLCGLHLVFLTSDSKLDRLHLHTQHAMQECMVDLQDMFHDSPGIMTGIAGRWELSDMELSHVTPMHNGCVMLWLAL